MQPLTFGLARLDVAHAKPAFHDRQPAEEPGHPLPERFMVMDRGCALLGPDGAEKERLESITSSVGAISPNGRWAAFNKSDRKPPFGEWQGKLAIQSRVRPQEQVTVPLIWGTTGSSFLPIWSTDSKRILICEQGFNEDRSRGSASMVYDLRTKRLTELKLPNEWWPSDWSADGKRLLTGLRTGDVVRVAWVNTDGTGRPEFITSEHEVSYGAKMSPDGRRILCIVGPKVNGNRARLQTIDLTTKKRVVIDRPGLTHGYCWSSDGLKIAYTWQLPLREPDEVVERKTYLITCDADGGNRKIVTMRKYEVPPNISRPAGMIIFFQVISWWR
jgi:Tol biopolymer transport system component